MAVLAACLIAGSLGYGFANWHCPRCPVHLRDFLISDDRMRTLTAGKCEALGPSTKAMLDIANSIVSTWPPEDEVVNGFGLGDVVASNDDWCRFSFASGSDLYIDARSVARIVSLSEVRLDVYVAIDAALECDQKPSFSISVINDRGEYYAFDTRHAWFYHIEHGRPRRLGSNQ